jgi:hypothetical protein
MPTMQRIWCKSLIVKWSLTSKDNKELQMKVVINICYGGFSLSEEAVKWLKGQGVENVDEYSYSEYQNRTDPMLIKCVETLGKSADSWGAQLKVVEIPEDVDWTIHDYDGLEWVAELHRTWR